MRSRETVRVELGCNLRQRPKKTTGEEGWGPLYNNCPRLGSNCDILVFTLKLNFVFSVKHHCSF